MPCLALVTIGCELRLGKEGMEEGDGEEEELVLEGEEEEDDDDGEVL